MGIDSVYDYPNGFLYRSRTLHHGLDEAMNNSVKKGVSIGKHVIIFGLRRIGFRACREYCVQLVVERKSI